MLTLFLSSSSAWYFILSKVYNALATSDEKIGAVARTAAEKKKVQELKTELNLQHLQVWSNFPCMPHEHVMKSVKLFSEKVMPEFSG